MSAQKLPPLPVLRSRKGAPGPTGSEADSPFWREVDAVSFSDAVTGLAGPQGTRVKTAWTDEAWHVLFEVEDNLPWATFDKRESPLWEEEVVEVFFDPIGDLESYFEIEINPLGTVKDLVLRRTANGWRKDFAWAVEGLQSFVRRTSTGWSAELAIPFAALGASVPGNGAVWRANFLRIDRPSGPGTEADLSAWSPTGMRQFHRAERFGFIEFLV